MLEATYFAGHSAGILRDLPTEKAAKPGSGIRRVPVIDMSQYARHSKRPDRHLHEDKVSRDVSAKAWRHELLQRCETVRVTVSASD